MTSFNHQLHIIQNQLSLLEFKQYFARMVTGDDTILFLNDSVLSLVQIEFSGQEFEQLIQSNPVMVIDEQIQARAVKPLPNHIIQSIDYAEFVDLCKHASNVISW